MSGYKDVLKKGWHPDKGSSLKGQMKSLVGRGEDQTRRNDHAATPLSSLRDPASFAPPPKRNPNAAVGAASPTASSSPAFQTGPSIPPRTGTAPEAASDAPPAPPKPWRLDTTGLSTSHLPPPPGRKDGADGRSPPPPPAPGSGGRAPPSLPPRLPPRSASSSPVTPSPASSPALPARQTIPPPAAAPGPSQGYLNQSAITRLGAAGISVPGLGITPTSSQPPPPPARSPSTVTSPSSSTSTSTPHMNELQSRFGKLKTHAASSFSSNGGAA
ncbi:hypothetical protein C8A01DRAFT_40362, partial [Parachaetomium inaequale]